MSPLPSRHRAPPPRRASRWAAWEGNSSLWLMMLPGVLLIFVFHYIPMYGLSIAFKDFRMDLGILASPWIGLDHFARLFGSEEFLRALRNTLVISLLHLSLGFCAPLVLAILLNEVRLQGYKRGVQTLTYLPHFFSWVILGGIVLMVLAMDGPVNALLAALGTERIQFLTSDGWFLFTLIASGVWQGAGFGSVVYLAALSGISPSLYEAATVDGANRWQQVRHITLPSLKPTIVVLFILSLGGVLNAGFDQIYNLYNPLVYDVADILDTYVLRRLQTMDYSLGAAAGCFKAVVGFTLILLANTLARRLSGGEQGLW